MLIYFCQTPNPPRSSASTPPRALTSWSTSTSTRPSHPSHSSAQSCTVSLQFSLPYHPLISVLSHAKKVNTRLLKLTTPHHPGIQPGLTPTKAADGTTTILTAGTTPPIASYAPPGPPPPSAPHRYVFMLYEQPADFDATKFLKPGEQMGRSKRMRYDYAAFVKEAKLGPVVASNYFVSN